MKSVSIFTLFLCAAMCIAIFGSYKNTETKNEDTRLQNVKAIKIPSYMEFAGEQLPLDNFDVKERLDKELLVNSYWHSTTMQNMKRTTRYFPIIEPILAQYGVPDDFKYLAVAESGLQNAVSSAGARGIWQFMKPTATYYKLTINEEVDERYNVEMATEAACKYLVGAKKKFGSWTLAAAAYNYGEPRLLKRLQEQKATSYYDLHLNDETSRYVFRIIAMKEIYSHKEKYGFLLDYDDYYPPLGDHYILQVDEPITSLAEFAQKYGTTYRMLKLYNPWLRQPYLRNRAGKTYKIKIPK